MFENLFKFRKGIDQPKSQEVLAQSPELIYTPPVLLKTKKWVVHNNSGKVGIVADLDNPGTVIVHFVDSNGVTIEVGNVRVGELRVARWQEIPEARRPKDQVYAASLGYY